MLCLPNEIGLIIFYIMLSVKMNSMALYNTPTFNISSYKEIYKIYVALTISAKAQKGAHHEYANY